MHDLCVLIATAPVDDAAAARWRADESPRNEERCKGLVDLFLQTTPRRRRGRRDGPSTARANQRDIALGFRRGGHETGTWRPNCYARRRQAEPRTSASSAQTDRKIYLEEDVDIALIAKEPEAAASP